MCVFYGKIFIDFITANLLQSVIVKEFWLAFCRVTGKNKVAPFFPRHSVVLFFCKTLRIV